MPKAPPSRIAYLNKASELLMVASPEVSAHLRRQARSVKQEDPLTSCNACGCILVSSWNCVRKRKRGGASDELTCGMCSSKTDVPRTRKKSETRTQPDEVKIRSDEVKILPKSKMNIQPDEARPQSAQQSAKSNRKTRAKHKPTLQSLLADAKSTSRPQPNHKKPEFDLMDFLKI
ncbi:hypothetical protein K470DRAFT_285122 [Piedraia hortae CBS 480.64]|uniref:Uncharacterized protein n=1 Tax=Piedraia hortae CBS 480.64 TaxID=1314780 RepID=A0A6A7C2V5_9PEZI|nr:hypothetical protein K470DRAFT_285122 [Piedraia hortae CBS 480.64]